MPELPEVETVARYLNKRLKGQRVISTTVTWINMLPKNSLAEFANGLKNQTILCVERRGKYIVIRLKSKQKLILHLRMSGNLEVHPKSKKAAKHIRMVFSLANGKELRFEDTRKFGRAYLVSDESSVLGKLGPEPLDSKLDYEDLFQKLKSKKRLIKPLLLDQSFIAGVGNIYADESLWLARIHPKRRSNKISRAEANVLISAIKTTLIKAINSKGTDFGDGVVPYGAYRPSVYGRENKPCLKCSKLIKKIRLGQRGTHFCPKCQR